MNKLRRVFVEERLMKGLRVLEKAAQNANSNEGKNQGEEIKRLQKLWKELAGSKFANEKLQFRNQFNETKEWKAEKEKSSQEETQHQYEQHQIQQMKSSSPLKVYFYVEYQQIQKLIQIMDKHMNSNLNQSNGDPLTPTAITTTDMTTNQQSIQLQLSCNEVPDQWYAVWPNGPQYADQFIRCVIEIKCENEKLFNSIPSSSSSSSNSNQNQFNLSALLYPTSLLNSLKQQASRKLQVNVDSLTKYCAWGNHHLKVSESKSFQVTITGVMIEGSLFDQTNYQLKDCDSESPLQSQMPILSLYFLPKVSPIVNIAKNCRKNSFFFILYSHSQVKHYGNYITFNYNCKFLLTHHLIEHFNYTYSFD